MKYLGIDYGKRKVGLALSEGKLARSLKVLSIKGLEDGLMQVSKYIGEEMIESVVVGMPESGESKSIAKKFIKSLEQSLKGTKIKVVEIDETLSSQDAKNKMIEMGVKKKKRQKEDSYSAAEILQNYLDTLK